MSDTTGIQWTDATLNAIVGCDYVSDGCLHCYAATLHNRRYLAWKRGTFPTAPTQYHQPFFHRVQLMPERLLQPFAWRTPKRVFFNSMSDLWHEDVPDWFIARSFAMMALTPQHTWQTLTKRPERQRVWLSNGHYDEVLREANYLRELLPAKRLGDIPISNPAHFPLANVWLGVSVENQVAADERIPLLLQTPAAVRFLSCEPLLGPIDLINHVAFSVADEYGEFSEPRVESDGSPAIKWVIVGGESGPHARPMNARWAESLVAQCREADVPVFVKQLGQVWACEHGCHERHAGDPDEWPEALRVREFPTDTRE